MIVRTGAKAGFSEPQIIIDIVCDNKLSYHWDNRVYSWLEILSNQEFATLNNIWGSLFEKIKVCNKLYAGTSFFRPPHQ